MWVTCYEAERVMEERMKDAVHEADRGRLIQAAKGTRKVRGWRPAVASILSSLLGLLIRPQS